MRGIHLDLLGLAVDISGICLDLWAKRGKSNPLCSLTELLDKPGERVGQIRKLTRRIREAGHQPARDDPVARFRSPDKNQ